MADVKLDVLCYFTTYEKNEDGDKIKRNHNPGGEITVSSARAEKLTALNIYGRPLFKKQGSDTEQKSVSTSSESASSPSGSQKSASTEK